MKNILDIFEDLKEIEKCANNHTSFLQYLKNCSKLYQYNFTKYENNNILCKIKNSKAKLCLQVHYDALDSKDNTYIGLNTIVYSCMFFLMANHNDCEFLFIENKNTKAAQIDIELSSTYILSLNSQKIRNTIYAKHYKNKIIKNKNNLDLYEISLFSKENKKSDLIRLLSSTIKEAKAKLLDFNTQDLPFGAKAIIACHISPLKTHNNMLIEKVDAKSEYMNIYSDEIIDFMLNFSNSKFNYDNSQEHIHLSAVRTDHECIEVQITFSSVQVLLQKVLKTCETYGFETKNEKIYFTEEKNNVFEKNILETYNKYLFNSSNQNLPSGLETNLLKVKYPHIKTASLAFNLYLLHLKDANTDDFNLGKINETLRDIIRYCND